MAKGTRTLKTRKIKVGASRKAKSTPRQENFLLYWLDPKSETRGNAYQSAVRAGYSKQYAESLTSQHPDWFDERVEKVDIIEKVEQHFQEVLNMPSRKQVMGMYGPIFSGKGKDRKPLIDFHIPTIKEKTEVAEFLAETLGKKKYAKKENSLELPPLQTLIIINVPNGETNRVHTVAEAVGSTTVVERQEDN